MTVLATARLRLEPYAERHLDGLNALNTDPEVMRFLGAPEPRERTLAIIGRVQGLWRERGYSWWAFVEHDTGQIVGAGCVQNLRREADSLPEPDCPLELGWRLRRDRWGRGLATEAARAMGDFALDLLDPDALLAVCHPDNTDSAGVMRRLGMRDDGLQRWYGREMATYRISADDWRAAAARR